MNNASKANSFEAVTQDGRPKFKCLVCSLCLSSRQRILQHLTTIHNKSPMKRERKKYLDDPSLPIPKRTAIRRRLQISEDTVCSMDVTMAGKSSTADNLAVIASMDDDQLLDGCTVINDLSVQDSVIEDVDYHCLIEHSLINEDELTSDSSDDDFVDSDDTQYSSLDDDSDFEHNELCETQTPQHDLQTLALLSYACKFNSSASSVDKLLSLIKAIHPDSASSLPSSFKKLLSCIPCVNPQQFHYCSVCNNVFPIESPNVYKCEMGRCPGLRYAGPEAAQMKANRKARCLFTITDVESQLKQLLSKAHVWKAIHGRKQKLLETTDSLLLTDVTDGLAYKKLSHEGGFLDPRNTNVSCTFNTDGIPLFSSSCSKLWPVFLVVNELPPAMRFSRENAILAGIWQGKTKPPFRQYLTSLGRILSRLHTDGVTFPSVLGDHCLLTSKLGVLIGCVDLQAKGYIVNMTMHNGQYGCITCEQPGLVVPQGKGHTRSYPHCDEPLPMRNSEDIKENKAPAATNSSRIKGIVGQSGLEQFPCLDYVTGLVPDYMHGVLLGVTKTLLYKWLSSTNSGKPFFIGKRVSHISTRLQQIKPPDYVERLPRDLEKHYNHLKATELQVWLLHYAIPCLIGILPLPFLEHFALLSEGIHILLRDSIDSDDLLRAEYLLDKFYKDFAELYGAGSCGLNVHNIGAHLVFYVRQWGPLFGWSCFGFEDYNAKILKYVHGTGDVTQQIITRHNADLYLSRIDLSGFGTGDQASFIQMMTSSSNKALKSSKKASNCVIAGACRKFETTMDLEKELFVQACCHADDPGSLKKALRVTVRNDKFYGKEYTKMKKRQCNVAMITSGDIIHIEFFVHNVTTDIVYAVGNRIEVNENPHLFSCASHHIICVTETCDLIVIPADNIVEKLFFANIDGSCFVSKIPNRHGYGVLK